MARAANHAVLSIVGRATGRVHVTGASDTDLARVYSEKGAFATAGETPRVRRDTLAGSNLVLDVDVTDGDIHFVGENGAKVRLEGAMMQGSPATWVSATSSHVVLNRGGDGVHSLAPMKR